MDLRLNAEDEQFRSEAAIWLENELSGRFANLRGIANHTEAIAERRAWEGRLCEARWSCVGWPSSFNGRDANLSQRVIFAEEYARARAPARIGHIGVELIGPTILSHGTSHQKSTFLPRIAEGADVWCQGFSEPGAGSDLASVRTSARLDGDRWVIDGQKIWTSMAHFADWIFVLCRTSKGSQFSQGLSFLLVPVQQRGIVVRPIRQLTGDAEFNEVFFEGATTAAENIIGSPGDGWKIAMATLGFERGVSTLAQQMQFRAEFAMLISCAKKRGLHKSEVFRHRISDCYVGLA